MTQQTTNTTPASPKSTTAALPPTLSQKLLQTPLRKLLEKPLDEMTQEELSQYTKHLRSLRASAPVLRQQIESDEELGEEARKPAKGKSKAQRVDETVKLMSEYS